MQINKKVNIYLRNHVVTKQIKGPTTITVEKN